MPKCLEILPPADGETSGIYVFRIVDNGKVVKEQPQRAANKRAATQAGIKWVPSWSMLSYVTGAGVDPRHCGPFPYRKRAPGGGRKKDPNARVPLNARVRPDVLTGLKKRAGRLGVSLGEAIDQMHDATR